MGLAHSPSVVTDGLVLYLDAANPKSYPGSGITLGNLSGTGNSILKNGTGYTASNGGALVFDGSNDYVETQQFQFERTQSFSLCAWINPSVISNNTNYQILNNENSSYRGYQFSIFSSSRLGFSLRNNTSNSILVEGPDMSANVNLWQNVVVTYNGSSDVGGVKFYKNTDLFSNLNVLSNTLNKTTLSGETTWIGIRRPSSISPFNGRISMLMIYSRELSAAEVAQNFAATRGRFGL